MYGIVLEALVGVTAEIRRRAGKSHHTEDWGLASKTYLAALDMILVSTEQMYYKMHSLLLIQLTHFLAALQNEFQPDFSENRTSRHDQE